MLVLVMVFDKVHATETFLPVDLHQTHVLLDLVASVQLAQKMYSDMIVRVFSMQE
jgi:hypothetical protein